MKNSRILLADSDHQALSAMETELRNAGYEVIVAQTGADALALARPESAFDLVILDILLPEIDGLEVADWLRANTRIPFIFLSSRGDEETIRQAVSKGALAYLIKPVEIGQLVPAIEAARERGREIHQLREQEQRLNTALSGSRHISAAVGLLMERHRLSEGEAFEKLRNFARSQRRKLADVAEDFVRAAERCNLISGDSRKDPGSGSGSSSDPLSSLG